VADLSRYEVAGQLLLCRTCGKGGTRGIVKNFGRQTIDVAEMNTEISIHEADHHGVVFENDAAENAEAARRASQALASRADAVSRDLRESEYYRCYPAATAYRDGMLNGMGGEAGDLAGVLGPDAARALSRALAHIAAMSKDYPELIRSHNRDTCDDFACFIFGHLIDVARAVDDQLSG
jgi:hypothetical protein